MATRQRSVWLLAAGALLFGACSGNDSSTTTGASGTGGAGGSAETGGAGGASGAAETGGSTAGGSGGAAGTAGVAGSGGDAGHADASPDGAGAAAGTRGDAASERPPTVEAGEAGRCLAAGTLTVTASGSAGYLINDGELNAAITLCRGNTYTFSIDTPGHPFYIRNGSDSFDTGITGNHQAQGDLVFVVTNDTPSELAYQCEIHEWMTGAILIVD